MNSETLPENWEVVKLGEATEIIMGQSPKGDTYNTNGEGEPLINGPAEFGSEYPTPMQWTSKPTKLCKDGDILFCVRGNTTGRMNIADQRYCIGRGIAAIRERTQKSDTLFIRNLLEYRRSSLYRIAIGGGSTFPNISTAHLKNYIVSLPPLPEQRAIAHVLQTIQEAKAARQRERSLERERKAALMDYLFSYGTKGEPRKQTEIGEIPESWKLGTIGEICERIIDYRGRTPKFSESGIVHLRSSNVKEGRLTLKNDEITYVTDETYKSFMTRGLPKAGDIIFTTEGPLGESAMVPPNFRFSLAQRMVLLRADKTVLDSSYLLYVLYSEQVRKEYLGRATGSTAKGISSKNFQQVQVPLPCLPEQREIAISLTACDAKIVALEQEAEHLDELFHAMLDELMTGKRSAVPLIDAELPN